jgi:hypothetical protein
MLFAGCSQDPISLYLKYLWFEKKKSHFKNYKILAIEKLKKKPISKSSEKLEPVIKNKPPKRIESSLSKGLYALLAAVKLVKSPSKALFFQKLVNLTLSRRIPFLKDKNKFLG